eukprot:31533-Pelagococcus_subviridis.AAC.7
MGTGVNHMNAPWARPSRRNTRRRAGVAAVAADDEQKVQAHLRDAVDDLGRHGPAARAPEDAPAVEVDRLDHPTRELRVEGPRERSERRGGVERRQMAELKGVE